MKLYNYSFALLLGIGTLTACEDKLEVTNPNQQTTGTFGFTSSDLEECVIAAYNHIRMEGTYARVMCAAATRCGTPRRCGTCPSTT